MAIELHGICPLLQVFDMPAALRFYCEVLGFEQVSRSPTYATENGIELFHWVLLRLGNTELMLNTAYDEGERPPGPDAKRQAAHHDTELFFACPDVEVAYTHLHARGVPCNPPHTARYGMRQLSLCDPDGYGITLQHSVETK